VSPAPFAVALLPGPGDDDMTRSSVRAEAGADVPIVPLAEAGGGAALLARAETIAFARAGDRWRAGALAARLRPFAAHPTAVLAVAGHVLVDAEGHEVLRVSPPPLPLDAEELLLRAAVEPSAVLVRASALDEAALALLLRPHGDLVLWSRLARASGLLRSGEIAAEVLLDPERHGSHHEARTAALLAAAAEVEGEGASAMRRELLRRLYLDAGPTAERVDLTALLGGTAADPDRAAAVFSDLQWALERARETLAAERVSWPPELERDADAPGVFVEEELFELRAAVRTTVTEVEVRDALLRRYEAEIQRRDAIISRLTSTPLGALAAAERPEPVDEGVA
jgi:hypothetical protein